MSIICWSNGPIYSFSTCRSPRRVTTAALRAVRTEDAEALSNIANGPDFRHGTLRMPFETVMAWQKRIANAGSHDTWIVAEIDEELVGYGMLYQREMSRMAHVGEIIMGVGDQFVGKGIGSAILAGLLDVADNWLGLRRIELDVYADNERAIRLYRRQGFLDEGRRQKAVFRAGEYVDTIAMARLRF